ncbi:MAG TPA: cupin domain-containing protein [Candidatus Lustribacter sp.]|jgi:gentisate 1,2-dioxygenase|nr:cupin domain-containing protein [Candidatus Lustribacter sp.]
MAEAQKPYDHTQNERVFVRGIEGQYNLTQELNRLRSLPRVRKGSETPFHGYPQFFNRDYLIPAYGLGQTLHIHLEEYAPGGVSQKHGHVNEAVFYILDGIGAEVHDGIRYEWEAGDIAIVHNNCVHQHFNRSTEKPARCLVMKTKPMYMFMNMLFQRTIIPQSREPSPTGIGYQPRQDPSHFEHEYDHDHPSTGSGQAHHDHSEHAHVHWATPGAPNEGRPV